MVEPLLCQLPVWCGLEFSCLTPPLTCPWLSRPAPSALACPRACVTPFSAPPSCPVVRLCLGPQRGPFLCSQPVDSLISGVCGSSCCSAPSSSLPFLPTENTPCPVSVLPMSQLWASKAMEISLCLPPGYQTSRQWIPSGSAGRNHFQQIVVKNNEGLKIDPV